MEIRIKYLFLSLILASGVAFGDNSTGGASSNEAEPVIKPDLERRQLGINKIDTENFELGLFYGLQTIQDFGANDLFGIRGAYHATEDVFLEFTYGESRGGKTTYERISGGAPLLSKKEREYRFYSLDVGWNILPGEVFLWDAFHFTSALYLVAGVGSTSFGGDDWFTVNVGAGYRILFTDYFAVHVDARDYLFDRNLFGFEETTNNLEFSLGMSFFF